MWVLTAAGAALKFLKFFLKFFRSATNTGRNCARTRRPGPARWSKGFWDWPCRLEPSPFGPFIPVASVTRTVFPFRVKENS